MPDAQNKKHPIWVLFVLEVTVGFEPTNNGVADRGLTTWLRHHTISVFTLLSYCENNILKWGCCYWSGLRVSNPPPQPWQGCALPNELNPQMVPPIGIEPTTRGFSVPCSTNWATEANWRPDGDSNPGPLAWQASVLTNWTTRPLKANTVVFAWWKQ